MADVQLEHGHIRLANRLVEAILEAGFEGSQLRILLGLLRLTYGWRRKSVRISVPDLAQRVHLSPTGGFRRALRELVHEGVVLMVDEGGGSHSAAYSIQKNFTAWGRFSVAEARLSSVWDERPVNEDRLLRARPTVAPEGQGDPGTPHPTGVDSVSPQGNAIYPHRDRGTGSNSPSEASLEPPKDIERQERHATTTAGAREQSVEAYAIGLAKAANRSIAKRWGEQPNAMHFARATQLASELIERSVPLRVAQIAIVACVERSKNEKPPASFNFFADAIDHAAKSHEQRALEAESPDLPVAAPPTNGRRREPTPIRQVVFRADPDEKALKLRYDAEQREAGIAWGKDPANATDYAACLAAANDHYQLMLETEWGQRLRDAMVVVGCAGAAGFPSFADWVAAQGAQVKAASG